MKEGRNDGCGEGGDEDLTAVGSTDPALDFTLLNPLPALHSVIARSHKHKITCRSLFADSRSSCRPPLPAAGSPSSPPLRPPSLLILSRSQVGREMREAKRGNCVHQDD